MAFDIEALPVKIIKSKRKSISIELKPEGILVRAPYRMNQKAIYDFIYEKSNWIEKHWNQMQKREEQNENMEPFTMDEIKALAEKAKIVIPQKVKYFAPIIGVDYGRITIRNQRTRWGSCSGKGNLNFNCLLMLFPDDVIDYVVVHELCHRKQMNHSARFYEEVEKVFPDYRKCQKWLKENGMVYMRRMQ